MNCTQETQKIIEVNLKRIKKSDLGTNERIENESFKHEPIGLTAGSPIRRRILSQTIIDRYRQRKIISERQYQTALYLYSLYFKATKSSKNDFMPIVDSSKTNHTENQLIGLSEYLKAVDQLSPNLFYIVQWVVIYGCTAGSYDEKYLNKKRLSVINLKEGLNNLSEHFRIR